jgi:hypothetical protein
MRAVTLGSVLSRAVGASDCPVHAPPPAATACASGRLGANSLVHLTHEECAWTMIEGDRRASAPSRVAGKPAGTCADRSAAHAIMRHPLLADNIAASRLLPLLDRTGRGVPPSLRAASAWPFRSFGEILLTPSRVGNSARKLRCASPLVVVFGECAADDADGGASAREDAYHISSPPDPLVQSLNGVVAIYLSTSGTTKRHDVTNSTSTTCGSQTVVHG